MYDHIGLRVKNLEASVRFYTAALAPLGFVAGSKGDEYAGFGPQGAPALWLHAHKGPTGPGAHIAFRAPNREAVDRFHAEALKSGGKDHGKPGLRTEYAPNYYGAFVIDLDGNNIEAVCHT